MFSSLSDKQIGVCRQNNLATTVIPKRFHFGVRANAITPKHYMFTNLVSFNIYLYQS